MATKIPIWPGSSSFFPGDTPFGLYDTDTTYQTDIEKSADWCAKRLGYPIVDIELQDINFYTCFEEAVTEYSTQVNFYNIKENLLTLKGTATGSNLTHKEITPTHDRLVTIAKSYGAEAGVGGNVTYYSASISVTQSQQVYDLTDPNFVSLESGTAGVDDIEVKKVYYQGTPAMSRYFDPYVGTGYGSDHLLDGFGMGNYSPAVNFLMMPMYDDLLRVQAIEFNDTIRKSAYSFQLVNDRLKIFPKPSANFKMWIEYVKRADRKDALKHGSVANTVTDFSNAGYDNMLYRNINDPGKQWIRKYTLALAKELLGNIRSKYGSIPIPGSETNLDGDTLRSEASVERENLITQLREDLEAASRRNLLERQQEESDFMNQTMNKIPYGIYIG
jgi:hypothetical protein|tara:strand:- start:581 stop:1744 length:1164 start_codon:yes stop_codon:yes gene_type:complete